MAVLQMKTVSVIGLARDLPLVAAACGKMQIFSPDDPLKFYKKAKSEGFKNFSLESPYKKALQKLEEITAKAGESLEFVGIDTKPPKKIKAHVNDLCKQASALDFEYQTAKLNLEKTKRALENIRHFTGLDIDLEKISACKYIKVRLGKLPQEGYKKLVSYSADPDMYFVPYSHDDNFYWGAYVALASRMSEVERKFTALYFEKLKLEPGETSLEKKQGELSKKVADQTNIVLELQIKRRGFWDENRKRVLQLYTFLAEQDTYFKIRNMALKYGNFFVLVGWVPAAKEHEVQKQLEKLEGIEFAIEDPWAVKRTLPPVHLENNKFSRPYEMMVEMYGLPSYGELDPTILVSVVYTLLYGIMFADVGQGLVLALIGFIMHKKKKMPLGKILVRCGLCGTLFGFLFGSVFGLEHALDPLYHAMGLAVKPIEPLHASGVILILGCSVFLGAAVILLSMLANISSCLKRDRWGPALFAANGLAGILFYGSTVTGAVGMLFGVKLFTPVYVSLLIVLPLVVIFFREILENLLERKREHIQWGEFLMQNVFEVFEVLLSFIANTMSFLRVGAYVLIHAGMMTVFLSLAELFHSPVAFVAVLAVGNVFVIVLEGLLVGLQVMRLSFYEFFGRFFEGQGRAFEPISFQKVRKN